MASGVFHKLKTSFSTLPIRAKSTAIIIGICAVALITASFLQDAFNFFNEKTQLLERLSITAKVFSMQTVPALQFEDPKAATENLSALKYQPDIKRACIYNDRGEAFASYPEWNSMKNFAGEPLCPPARPEENIYGNGMLRIFRDITAGDHKVGIIYIEYDLSGMYRNLGRGWLINIAILVIAVILAFLLSSYFQHAVSEPIMRLAAKVREFSKSRDYSIRARKENDDELGELVDTFNRMIEEIGKTVESRELLAAIVESSDDAIISKNLDGIINSWNVGAAKVFGYSAEEAVGKHINLIIPHERLQEERYIVGEIKKGRSVEHFETIRHAKDGHDINISLTVSPIRDNSGKIIGASKIAHDITQRKQGETEIARYMRELERSNQELDDFAYIASHDLKEPLRGLFNHASFLLEDYQDKLDEDGVRRLHRLSDLAARMEDLVNDLLYFSRLGRAELAIQEINPNEIITDIEQMIEPFLKERNARIIVPKPMPRITCDRPRITEVFRNLITNAVKYNDKEERIVEVGFLEMAMGPEGLEKKVFYIKDNGIGIAEEFHQEIFRIFKRLQNSAGEKEQGTGVGLTFVKKIVERHKGRIWLESKLGEGTVFYFNINQEVS